MSHVLSIPRPAESFALSRGFPGVLPPPLPAVPFRFRLARPEPWWREALRWSLGGLAAGWAAGEATLWLIGV